jgi:outer membrane cobalamin receptor
MSGMFLLFLFSTTINFAQDATKVFEGVTVRGTKDFTQETQFGKEDIEKLAPFDLGHLLQNSAGIALRDYGGLGGMKTLSIRGLGGEHTKLIVNGQAITNAQNGQTDFGLIQLDNVEEVNVTLGPSHKNLLPVSAHVMGSSVEITTFENSFSSRKHQVRASSTVGSFGQKEIYGGYKYSKEKFFISASGKYRQADGDYTYRIPFGNQWMEGTRKNNEFQEVFISLGAGVKTVVDTLKQRYHFFKLNAQVNTSRKQLPGAVIFYNDYSDESLSNTNYRVGADYSILNKKLKARIFGGFNQDELHYFDPTYFNQDGFIDNYYKNQSAQAGVTFNYTLTKQLRFLAGTDAERTYLYANRANIGVPRRLLSTSMLGFNYVIKFVEASAKLFHQYLEDENRMVKHVNSFQRWNPQIQFTTSEELSKNISFYMWTKRTMRAPSFNEMYYSQIGNTSLVPEDSWQFNLGSFFNKQLRSTRVNFKINGYYNQVTNKIIAVPTQNLFIWSIANIGEVEVKGIDTEAQLFGEFNTKTQIQWRGNLTYQEVFDVTDETSPTFRHQIMYTPKWSSSNTFSFYFQDISFHQTTYFVGERYSLSQNIPANRLDPFLLFDASLEYKLAVRKEHVLKFQGGIRNIANSSYAYIRNFVMPGRNYFIKLSYALH